MIGSIAALALLGLTAAALAGTRHALRNQAPPASVTTVGAVQGTAIAAYASSAHAEVTALAGKSDEPVYALVSLIGYGTPAQIAAVANGITVSKAFIRVPLVGVQTEIGAVDVTVLPDDLAAKMRSTAEREERDAADADRQAMLLTGGSAREKQLREFYQQSARVLRAEAQNLRGLCSCVYALVVRGTPQQLAALATRQGVRIVDPAPEIASTDDVVFLPVLPEQTTTVQPPSNTGAPALPRGT